MKTPCIFKGNGWPSKVPASRYLLQSPLKLRFLFLEPVYPKYYRLASRFHHLQLGSEQREEIENKLGISCSKTNMGRRETAKSLSVATPLTSIGRGAPNVENPTFPGANVTLPGSEIPGIPHRPAYIKAPYSSTGFTGGWKQATEKGFQNISKIRNIDELNNTY